MGWESWRIRVNPQWSWRCRGAAKNFLHDLSESSLIGKFPDHVAKLLIYVLEQYSEPNHHSFYDIPKLRVNVPPKVRDRGLCEELKEIAVRRGFSWPIEHHNSPESGPTLSARHPINHERLPMREKTKRRSVRAEQDTVSRELVNDVRRLVEVTRTNVSPAVNAALTMLDWRIRKPVGEEILGRERARYGAAVPTLC